MDVIQHPAWSTPISYLSETGGNTSDPSISAIKPVLLTLLLTMMVIGIIITYHYSIITKALISQIRFHPVIPDSKESLERAEYRCLNANTGNTERNEILISNTAIPTINECNKLCEKTSQCVAALHDNGRCIMYSRCQPMATSGATGTLITFSYKEVPNIGETFAIDWIKLLKHLQL